MIGHRELTLDDYLAILRRRWWVIILPAILASLMAYGVSLRLQSRYTSRALVVVEGQRVPEHFVQPVVTQDLAARLGTMQEHILSRTRLQPIMDRFDLFKEDAGRATVEELVSRMRSSVSLTPVTSAMSSKEGELAAFNISFTAPDPRVAQQVCAEITSMFITENLRQREESAQGTTNFLQSQLDDSKRRLDEQDARLAQFKLKYLGTLPDEAQTNFNILTSLNTQLEAVTESLSRAQQDKAYAESVLAQQVAALEALKGGNNPHPEMLQDQVAAMENQLFALELQYTSNHPDVIKLKAAVEELKKNARRADPASDEKSLPKLSEAVAFEPPQIQQLRDQVHSLQRAIQDRTREQEKIQHQIKVYQSRVQLSPTVEEEYRQVTRDYQTALDFYNDLLRKKDQSEMATDLERRQQGEQFRVLDPADLPEKPAYPNRPMYAVAGFGSGLGLGLGLALLLELRDKSLRTDRDIEFYLGLPTVAMIPSIKTSKRGGSRAWPKRRKARAHESVGV